MQRKKGGKKTECKLISYAPMEANARVKALKLGTLTDTYTGVVVVVGAGVSAGGRQNHCLQRNQIHLG